MSKYDASLLPVTIYKVTIPHISLRRYKMKALSYTIASIQVSMAKRCTPPQHDNIRESFPFWNWQRVSVWWHYIVSHAITKDESRATFARIPPPKFYWYTVLENVPNNCEPNLKASLQWGCVPRPRLRNDFNQVIRPTRVGGNIIVFCAKNMLANTHMCVNVYMVIPRRECSFCATVSPVFHISALGLHANVYPLYKCFRSDWDGLETFACLEFISIHKVFYGYAWYWFKHHYVWVLK